MSAADDVIDYHVKNGTPLHRPTLDSNYEHRTQPSPSLHRLLGQFGWWLCDVAIRVLARKPER